MEDPKFDDTKKFETDVMEKTESMEDARIQIVQPIPNISTFTVSPKSSSLSYYSTLYYKMNAKGLAIIFNHYEYKTDSKIRPSKREGTHVDAERMKRCLRNLNYTVRVYSDKSVKEIKRVMDDVALMNSTQLSSLVVVVMTHGDPGILMACDDEYNIEMLWNGLTAAECPQLIGIPKLYFIQACRGSKVDSGYTYEDSVGHSNDTYKIPSMADFLQMYSTLPDHSSWREADGTWFIQSLCEVFEEVGTHFDLLQLLTFVNRKVALEYESFTTNPTSNRMKQIPQIVSMLTKLFKFEKLEKNYY